MNTLRCAVIGVGYLGKFHADKYALLPNAELVAVCDASTERAQEIAAIHNVEATTNYEDLIGKVDAVSIASTTTTHHKIAKACLENNIHVLLEKPITTTIEQADDLIKTAKTNNCVFQIGHLERFNPILTTLKTILDRPLFIESLRLSPFKPRGTDVNVVLDLMIHDIDLIQHLVDSPIKEIKANGAPILSKHADIANARIEFESGCIATVTASRVSFKQKRDLRIFQHNAYFSGDLNHKILSIHKIGDNEMFPGVPEIVREKLVLEKGDAILDEIKAFLDSIINNKPPVVTGAEGRGALATATKITQIALTNLERALQYEK